MDTKPRKYPVGTQIFADVIKEKMVYVDKTDLVWKLTRKNKYIFLSRPRRFGKTLLTSTLHSYFDGDKDLFEGLKIMEYETEWKKYPVIHVDLSAVKKLGSADALKDGICDLMAPICREYGIDMTNATPGKLLRNAILSISQKEASQIVVLIDEYDAPLLDVMHESGRLTEMKEVMQEFYQQLKFSEQYIHFCFITGITKFSQLSIFSSLNNIKNVSMLPEYAAICGISEDELNSVLQDDVDILAQKLSCTTEEAHARLKRQYDGYHFTKNSPDVYNPYSLLNCFSDGEILNYWFESGTPTMLINQIGKMGSDITKWERTEVFSAIFDAPTEYLEDLTPLLYQSGYLTIKNYDPDTQGYTLGIPNQEVRIGMANGLMLAYTGILPKDVQSSFGFKFYRALKKGDINLALMELKTFLAGVPYINGFKKKLEDIVVREAFYQYSLYLIFNTFNAFTRTEVTTNTGRVDMVVQMPNTTYLFEFKIRPSAEEAIQQIEEKHYADAFWSKERKVVKIGVQFDIQNWTILDWKIKEYCKSEF